MKPLALLLALLPGFLGLLTASEKRPNIVFFFADDQTTAAIGCYGNKIVQTPNIDALAARGVRFANAFVSHPICWVSRTTILTGLIGRSSGTPGQPELTRPEIAAKLCPDHLREAGYRTGFLGKWHAKMPPGYRAADHFDVFTPIDRNPYFQRQPDGTLKHETERIVEEGIEFLKNQPADQPFALHLWFNACHAEDNDRRPGIGTYPWPQSVDGLYEDIEIPPPRLGSPSIFESLPDFLKTSLSRERYFWSLNTPQKYQINARAYSRMTTGIDREIGRFLQAIEKNGLAANTIVVYSADNGYHFGNRGLSGKWSHFEESIRVPLIIMDPRAPADQRGKVSPALAMNLDLPPTFLDWAGAAIPQTWQGKSLTPLINGEPPADWRTETFHEHFAVRNRIPAHEGIRTAQFKYARYFDHGNYEFLHDLQADPDELVNLAGNPQYAQTLQSMRERTNQAVTAFGGPLPPLPAGAFKPSTEAHPIASAAVGSKPDAAGFVKLFDGKTLRGWTGDPQYWSVEDGAITGVTDGSLKMNRFLSWTGSTIRNFELRVKVKVTPGGNSGLQYRGAMRPEVGLDIVSGYQCDVVANNPDYNGMLYEERGRRILSHTGEQVIVAPDGQPWVIGKMEVKTFAPGEWHEFRVLVEGNHHRHWIDGHPTADLIDFDEKGRSLEGVLAVQVHVGPAMKIQYKDVFIKHLPDALPLLRPEDHPIPATAYGVRPQAKLPPDWKPPIYGELRK
ncbi:MAG: Arylsulfatase A [Verrucomicrobia bacterium]|nr:MAG: Arylsulfatase A [Verrucomicrobiota bacterium]